MSLRRKTYTIIGTILLGTAVLSCLFAWRYLLGGFLQAEMNQADDMVTLANRTIVNQINNLDVITKDWVYRNDIYYYILNHNSKFVRDNFSESKLKNIQIDYISCIDNRQRVIYNKFTGSDDNKTGDTPLFLPREKLSVDGSIYKGLTFFGNKPLLIVSRPIYRSNNSRSSEGRLIMGRFLDDYAFHNISALTGHKVSASINNSSRLMDGIWISLDQIEVLECVVIPVNNSHINGYGVAYVGGNTPVPIFRLIMPRKIYEQGMLSMRYLLMSIGFVELLFIIFTVWMLEGTILSRLLTLNTGVKKIGFTGDTSSRVYIPGKDELTNLAHEINGTLDALEQSKVDLQKAHDELEQRVEARTTDLAKANDSLRNSEQRMHTLINSLPFPFWAVDANGRYIMQNSVAEAGWGSAIGKYVDELSLTPDVLDLWMANNNKVFSGEIVNSESSYVINGEKLYHNYIISPVKDGDNITGAVGISIDVTEQKRLIENLQKNESALRESHRILEALMEYVPDGIAIADGPDITVKWISRYACELQGSKRSDIQGHSVANNNGDHNIFHLDGRPATLMELPIARAVKSGETVIDEEWIMFSSSGNPIPILVNAAPVKDESGSIIGSILAWRDITSIKEIHKALEDAFHREHHIADVLQRALIPDVNLTTRGYSFTARYKSALKEAEVGGDFYDIFTLPDGRIALLLGDVSGKGLPAAVYTAMAKYMLRAYVHEDPSPSYVMAHLNESMCDYTPEDIFATLFYGVLDPLKRTLIYANAGHDEPILYQKGIDSISLLDVTGRAVGIFKGCRYDVKSVRLKSGDILVVYTDGVTDSRIGEQFFGIEGISNVLLSRVDSDGEHIADAILDSATTAGGGVLRDDAAVLIMKVKSLEID